MSHAAGRSARGAPQVVGDDLSRELLAALGQWTAGLSPASG